MNRLAIALAALTLAAAGTSSARSTDAPPSTPGNFHAALYDKAGGELFWQRSTDDRGAVRGYEITKNGQNLGVFDALSYYDRSLEPGVRYTFTVAAVDSAGQRSVPATTTLGGGAPPPSGGPAAPAELRAEVYSRRSAELFWRREAAALRLRYEVRRDGRVVGTTDGVSYYTSALAAGTEYVFEVIAIDRQGRRSSASRVTLRTEGTGAPSPGDAGGPPAPADLQAEVYSRRSAELFWRREAAALRLRYEIRRDGQVVDTTNGVSYFTRDLAAGRDYVFEVVAIGRDGRRSAPSRITLRTDGDAPGLSAPANLRAEVYSSTAAELFWDRAATPRLRYEVRRDGRIVGTTDGTSFFDDALAADTTYRYEVVALGSGRRSAPSGVEVTTVGLGGSTSPEVGDGFTLETRPEAIEAIDVVSRFYDEVLPEERPYFVQREVSEPFSTDPFMLGVTESVLIDIDASGTGSYRDVVETESSDSISRERRIATRTNTGSSIDWSGTYLRTDSGSGRGETYEFTTETSSLGGRNRLQTGTITANRFGDGILDRGPYTVSYELRTGKVDGLRECGPGSGTIVYESSMVARVGDREFTVIDTVTTITKGEDDRVWNLRVTIEETGELVSESLIRSLALELFCDFPELRG